MPSFSTSYGKWKNALELPDRCRCLALWLLLIGVVGCSPSPRIDRAPDGAEILRLHNWLRSDRVVSWSGSGWAHIDTPDGEIEGSVQLNIDSPLRGRWVLESSGMFGMVSERVVVALPGDGWVLTHQKRADALERVPFAESRLRHHLPLQRAADLFALASGLPPWPADSEPGHLETGVRIVAAEKEGQVLTYRLRAAEETSFFLLRLEGETLSSFEWWVEGERYLKIDYDRWQTQGGLTLPSRIRIEAPQSSVIAEVTLDSWQRRDDFTAADFEVY